MIALGENKENNFVDVPGELKNFLESELNLDDYEPKEKEGIKNKGNQKVGNLITIKLRKQNIEIYVETIDYDKYEKN